MPEDLKLSQIGSSPLPPPFRGLHSPRVRKHCQIIYACYFRKSSIRLMLLYVHRDRTNYKGREARTATSTFTQLLISFQVQCCFTSTETTRTVRDGEPRTSTSTLTQLLTFDYVTAFVLALIAFTEKTSGLLGTSGLPRTATSIFSQLRSSDYFRFSVALRPSKP